jgi:hypothetical protein
MNLIVDLILVLVLFGLTYHQLEYALLNRAIIGLIIGFVLLADTLLLIEFILLNDLHLIKL